MTASTTKAPFQTSCEESLLRHRLAGAARETDEQIHGSRLDGDRLGPAAHPVEPGLDPPRSDLEGRPFSAASSGLIAPF